MGKVYNATFPSEAIPSRGKFSFWDENLSKLQYSYTSPEGILLVYTLIQHTFRYLNV